MTADRKTLGRLYEARKIIKDVGWTQGAWGRDEKGEVISSTGGSRGAPASYSIGAALLKTGGAVDLGPALLYLKVVTGTWNLEAWNDEPGRTKDDVVAALTAAIKAAEL